MRTAKLAVKKKINISVIIVTSWNAIVYKVFLRYSVKDA